MPMILIYMAVVDQQNVGIRITYFYIYIHIHVYVCTAYVVGYSGLGTFVDLDRSTARFSLCACVSHCLVVLASLSEDGSNLSSWQQGIPSKG